MRTPSALLLGVCVAALPSCGRKTDATADAEWWRLEARRVELAQQVELLKLRLERLRDREATVASAEQAAAQSSERLAELTADRAELRLAIAELDRETAETRKAWTDKTRAAATGLKFATFTGRSGRTYQEVQISRVTDVGVEFRHRDGSARLSAAELTGDQRDRFGLETGEAAIAREKELAHARAYEESVTAALAAKQAAEERAERELALAAAKKPVQARPSTTLASLNVPRRSRLDEPGRSFGRSSYSSSYYYYTPYRRYYYRPCVPSQRVNLFPPGSFNPRPTPTPTPVCRPTPISPPTTPHVTPRFTP